MFSKYGYILAFLYTKVALWFEATFPSLIGCVIFLLLATPILAIILLVFQRNVAMSRLNNIATLFSSIQLLLSSYLMFLCQLQPEPDTIHLFFKQFLIGPFSFSLAFGIDGFALVFIMLTALMTQLCVIYTWDFNYKDLNSFFILIFLTSFSLFTFFLASDLFLFYLAFESVLIPLFLMIGLYGSRERRIHAAYQFFFYTLIGSFFMLLSIVYIFNQTGTTLFCQLKGFPFTLTEQLVLWAFFAFALAVKIPLPPLHIWLPEAHVEAPTVGSVLLAAVVLKMGGFGIIRILFPLFPQAMLYYQSLVFTICAVGMLYAALTAVRQLDIKKIIAYSSVVHMAYCTMGLFSFNTLTISSAVLGMFAHGLISGALFFCVGCLYDRYQTRDLHSYGALIHFSPILGGIFFFVCLANMGFPGTANFPSEVGIYMGLFLQSTFLPIFLIGGLLLNSVYNIWLSTRLVFGPFSSNTMVYNKAFDLTIKEKAILYTLCFWIVLLGLFPGNFLAHLDLYVRDLIENIK